MKRDHLDEAIDAVATRMTSVEPDSALASRIADALPERSGWLPWIRMARLAIGVGVAGVAITMVLRLFDDGATQVRRTASANAPLTSVEPSPNDRRTPVEPPSHTRRTPVEPSPPETSPGTDHEFSLAPLASAEALALSSLSPPSLPPEDALTIDPLHVADLPLTVEFPER
jgi:hypothetical protein